MIKKPTKILKDGNEEISDIAALHILFDYHKDTGEPYEVATIYDSQKGMTTIPLKRLELIS